MMILESDRLLFCANPEYTPHANFGFVKKNLFEIFCKKSSWTFSIKFTMPNNCENYTTIFSVEGIDLSLDLDTRGNIIFRADNNSMLFETPWLKDKLNLTNIFTLKYNLELKLYLVYVNDIEVGKLAASDQIYNNSEIKLCCILRQYSKLNKPNSIVLENILFAGEIISNKDLDILSNYNSLSFKQDKYQRLLIEGVNNFNLYCLCNFKNNMFGKVWDNTGNNNFFFTSLPEAERKNKSVI